MQVEHNNNNGGKRYFGYNVVDVIHGNDKNRKIINYFLIFTLSHLPLRGTLEEENASSFIKLNCRYQKALSIEMKKPLCYAERKCHDDIKRHISSSIRIIHKTLLPKLSALKCVLNLIILKHYCSISYLAYQLQNRNS